MSKKPMIEHARRSKEEQDAINKVRFMVQREDETIQEKIVSHVRQEGVHTPYSVAHELGRSPNHRKLVHHNLYLLVGKKVLRFEPKSPNLVVVKES